MATSLQSVALTNGGTGISLAAGSTGDSQNPILIVKSLIAGPGITIVASSDRGDVTISATGLPALTSLLTASVQWNGSTPASLPIFIAAYPVVVTAIIGRIEASSTTTPAGLTLVKAPNNTALVDGSALTTAALDVTATPYAIQNLALTPDTSVLTLAVGDCIGVQITGTWTGASGSLTVHMAPSLQTN